MFVKWVGGRKLVDGFREVRGNDQAYRCRDRQTDRQTDRQV